MADKEIKRGYVKWTDEDGTFHKEPLADHPELLKAANEKQQLQAEEARRLNDAAEETLQARDEDVGTDYAEALEVLKDSDALTAAEALAETDAQSAPVAAPEEPVKDGRTTLTVSDERAADANYNRNRNTDAGTASE